MSKQCGLCDCVNVCEVEKPNFDAPHREPVYLEIEEKGNSGADFAALTAIIVAAFVMGFCVGVSL